MLTGKNLIGYATLGEGDNIFSSSILRDDNSADFAFNEASEEQINQAATLAHKAFASYRLLPAEKKAAFIEKIAEGIGSAKDELVKMAMHETNLPKPRLEGEVQRTINQLKLFAQLLREGSWVKAIIDTAQPDRAPLPKPDIRQIQIPLGVVAVFGASNFPFAFSVAGGDTVSALAAGCTVVYKSHPGHPATSEMTGAILIQAAKDSDVPEGVFSLLQGKSNQCSISLVTHPLIKAVGFTGSLNGGKAIFDAAAKRSEPIPVYAEMGSTNPVFILPKILEQQRSALAEKLALSNLLSAGQFCTNPGILVSVDSADTKSFADDFSVVISKANADSMLTENIYNNYNAGIQKLLASEDVKVIASGKEDGLKKAATAYMFQTSADNFLSNENLVHEVFGPASVHVTAASSEELYEVAKRLPGQITISIWGTDEDLAENTALIHELELKAGRIIFNNVPTGVEVTHAMVHGGPYPATTDSRSTSVGTTAIYRFTRAVCYQNSPQDILPEALKNENPSHIWRQVNGKFTADEIN
ncbi:MAG: aldehyde dehydrogenase (NADP(+)) [Ferruginibacter sp.]